jgi:hypothetical protein
MLGPGLAGPRVGRCFIGPDGGLADSFSYYSFFFNFSFLKNNALFVYIFSNKFWFYILIRL